MDNQQISFDMAFSRRDDALAEAIDKLNKEQKEAVMQIDGPLLILAGAGSGKTNTITHRIAHMIKDCGVSPYNILAVTFTNKAAGEMRERVEKLIGHATNMWIMTFHAACLRILRRHAEVLGFSNSFTVYDPVDCKAVVKSILKEIRVDEKQFSVSMLLNVISDCKEKEMTPEEYKFNFGGGYREEIIYKVYNEYQKVLKKNNAMDFDDLLWNALRVLQKDERVLEEYQDRFQYIMVDEYQDTNTVQYRFVKTLADKNKNICVVGDDDQCIYQWRGADISNILGFEHDFPGATVIKLERNYRSTGNILEAAHSVIKNNKRRKEKKLWTSTEEGEKIVYFRAEDENEEARYVAQEIDRLQRTGRMFNDFAVLYRTNAQSRKFEDALSNRNIPYRVVGGVRYYDRKEIKDIVAYMRLVENPDDELAFNRIINEPKRGVGNTTKEKLAAFARVRNESLYNLLCDDEVVSTLSGKAAKAVKELMEALIHYHEEKDNLRISDIYDGLLGDTGYMKALEDMHTVEADGRLENLLEFRSVIREYESERDAATEGSATLSDFLERIALLSDIDNHDPDENAVALMTLHSAKGLEFPFVFMPGMEDGLFPSWRSLDAVEGIEEERRLCYVGITRARERLCMTSAGYRMLYGKGSFQRESTFLRELDPKLMTGDGVYQKRDEARTGDSIGLDGYGSSQPYRPYGSNGGYTSNQFAAAKREIKAPKKNTETFEAGDRVSHGKFGEGLVIESNGKVISVMFDSVGLKKLAADLAPIKKI